MGKVIRKWGCISENVRRYEYYLQTTSLLSTSKSPPQGLGTSLWIAVFNDLWKVSHWEWNMLVWVETCIILLCVFLLLHSSCKQWSTALRAIWFASFKILLRLNLVLHCIPGFSTKTQVNLDGILVLKSQTVSLIPARAEVDGQGSKMDQRLELLPPVLPWHARWTWAVLFAKVIIGDLKLDIQVMNVLGDRVSIWYVFHQGHLSELQTPYPPATSWYHQRVKTHARGSLMDTRVVCVVLDENSELCSNKIASRPTTLIKMSSV